MELDRILIEQSIAKQYGVLPSEQENLRYADWSKLVGGLMHDTPLGQVVAIRSEEDRERIRHFTPEQRSIRNDWRNFLAEKQKTEQSDTVEQKQRELQTMIFGLFGGDR